MLLIIVIVIVVILIIMVLWQTALIEIAMLGQYSGSKGEKVIGLSFDDGPDWGEEQLIRALNQTGMTATFFWIGDKVDKLRSENDARFMNLLQLLVDSGHEVGMHGLHCSMPPMWKRIWGVTSLEDIGKTRDKFSALCKYEPLLYRPHGFQLGRKLYRGIRGSGVLFVVGSLWLAIGPERQNLRSKYVKKFSKAGPGNIICGHDSCDNHTNFGIACEISRVITDKLVDILNSKGLKARKLSEVIR